MKTNKTRSICVYTWTIYTYMHHHIANKNDIPSWPSLCTLWNTRSKWGICVLNQLFSLLFSEFHRRCWFLYKKYHFSWKPTKPGQYVCILVPFTHTCTTKYHQNMIYLVGLPSVLYERPGQMRDLCWISCFCCFSCAFQSFSWKASLFIQRVPTFMRKTEPGQYVCIHAPFTHTCTTKYHKNIMYT